MNDMYKLWIYIIHSHIIYLYQLFKSVISNTDNKLCTEASILQFVHLADAKFARRLVFVISVIKAVIASVEFYEQNWKPIFCSPDTKIQLSAEFTRQVDNDILIRGMNNKVDDIKVAMEYCDARKSTWSICIYESSLSRYSTYKNKHYSCTTCM